MTSITRLKVRILATFVFATAFVTAIMYITLANPNESAIIHEVKQMLALYGYINICIGFIVGYAIQRSHAEHPENEENKQDNEVLI